jgi:dipeptidyl aminopeptidase/acylaminoacyl peptidase
LKTVRLNHLRAALLAVAAAGLLAAAGLVVILYAQPAEANYPGKPAKIAFSGYERNDSEIYTIKPDGGGRIKLTNNKAGNYQPAYSPDGKRIAYVGFDGHDTEIYTINAGGGGRFNVTDNGTEDYEASWGSLQEQDKRQDREDREDPERPPELRGHEAVDPEER